MAGTKGVRIQDWRLYGERGLAHQPVTVWVYEGTLKLEYQAVTLTKYRVELYDDRKHIKEVSNPRVAETVFRAPQLTLFDLGSDEWLLYWKAPSYAHSLRRQPGSKVTQPFRTRYSRACGARRRRAEWRRNATFTLPWI